MAEKSIIYNSDKVKITSNWVDVSTVKWMDEQISFADNWQIVMAVLHWYDTTWICFGG